VTNLGAKILALHRALKGAAIPHAVGGATALAYAVRQPRATNDIDLNIFLPAKRSPDVLAALPPDIRIRPEDREALAREGQIRLRWDQTPVDLFFSTVAFHDAAAERIDTVPFEGSTIPVLSPTDLAVCKAMFARGQDWVDIEAMRDASSINADEALRWVARMRGPDDPSYTRLEAILVAPPTPLTERDELPPGLRPPAWGPARSDESRVRPPTN
jgi:hypothetical protein